LQHAQSSISFPSPEPGQGVIQLIQHYTTPQTVRTHESNSVYSEDFEEENSSMTLAHSMSLEKFVTCFMCKQDIKASEALAHSKTCRLNRMKSWDRNESSLSPRESIEESLEVSATLKSMLSPREVDESKSKITSTVIEEYSDDFEVESA
jgi:hypothetical protein